MGEIKKDLERREGKKTRLETFQIFNDKIEIKVIFVGTFRSSLNLISPREIPSKLH